MDSKSDHAIRLLESIATSNDMLIDLSQKLRSNAQVTHAQHSLECRRYQTGVVLEGYVDAELHNGKAVSWWIEVSWDQERWSIQTSVLVNDEQGQRTLKEFNTRTPKTLDEVIIQLREATSMLVTSAFTIDLDADLQ